MSTPPLKTPARAQIANERHRHPRSLQQNKSNLPCHNGGVKKQGAADKITVKIKKRPFFEASLPLLGDLGKEIPREGNDLLMKALHFIPCINKDSGRSFLVLIQEKF